MLAHSCLIQKRPNMSKSEVVVSILIVNEASMWSVPSMSILFCGGMTMVTATVSALFALSLTSDRSIHESEPTIESIPYLPK